MPSIKPASHEKCTALAEDFLSCGEGEGMKIHSLSGNIEQVGNFPQFVHKGRCYVLVVVDVGTDA